MAANGQKELQISLTAQDKASGVFARVQSAISNVTESAKKFGDQAGASNVAAQAFSTALGFSLVNALSFARQQLADCSKQALEFETAMARINTVMRGSPEQVDALAASIKDISLRLPVSAKELADAGYQIASAGVAMGNIAPVLELSAQVAVGAMTDTETAFNGIIAVIKGYGMNMTEATAVADMFFKANELGQTTVGEIAVAIQGVATKANAAGVSLQELMAVYATFTGVTGKASNVTTQLEGAIAALASPTQSARAKMDELGISYGKAAIEEKGFAEVAKEVYDAVDGDTVALRELIPEKEALTLVTALATTQYDKFKESLDAVTNSTGALKSAVETMSATTETKLVLMQNKVNAFKMNVGKAMLWLKVTLIDFGYVMAGAVEVTVSGLMYISAGFQAAFGAATRIAANFIGNFGGMAKEVYQIAKNIATNIKAAFTGGDFVPITDGAKRFQQALSQVSAEMSGPFQAAHAVFEQGVKNLQGLSANTASAIELMGQQFGSTGDAADGASGSFDGFGNSAGSASEKTDKLDSSIKKLEDTYASVEESAVKALDNVKTKTEETLNELDKKITDIYSKMEEATASFMKENAKSNEDLASAYVDQEEKVSDLLNSIKEKQKEIQKLQEEMSAESAKGQDTTGTQSQIGNAQEDIAALQEQYSKELEALQSFATEAQALQEQITEARRRAQLTDFERTIEDINSEKAERQKAFDERMLQLTQELLALQDQKAKIVALEQETVTTLNALRLQAATIYEGILQSMSATTTEEVEKMIGLLKSLQEQTGAVGGENLNTSIGGIVTPNVKNDVSIKIDVSQANGELNTEQLAQYIIAEITRQLQLQTLSSSA